MYMYLENDEESPEANEALQGRVKTIDGEEGYVLVNIPTGPYTTAWTHADIHVHEYACTHKINCMYIHAYTHVLLM